MGYANVDLECAMYACMVIQQMIPTEKVCILKKVSFHFQNLNDLVLAIIDWEAEKSIHAFDIRSCNIWGAFQVTGVGSALYLSAETSYLNIHLFFSLSVDTFNGAGMYMMSLVYSIQLAVLGS